MDDLARLVGERLRAARRERGLSLGALAEAAGIGKGSLSEIENGARNPTLAKLIGRLGILSEPAAKPVEKRGGRKVLVNEAMGVQSWTEGADTVVALNSVNCEISTREMGPKRRIASITWK